jgi:multiple sugar transport system substrate-binding protein
VARRLVVSILAVVLSTALLLPSAAAHQKRGARTIIVHFESWVLSKSDQSQLTSLLTQFQKSHRHIRVVFTPLSGNVESQLEAQFLSHSAPDVFELDMGWARDFIQAGVIQRLDRLAYRDRTFHAGDFNFRLLGGLSARGKIYAYPVGYSTLGLWYDRSRFKTLHIKHPPTDWKSFGRVACALTDKKKHLFGAVLSPDAAHWFAFLRTFGGRVLNGKATTAQIDSKQSIQALQWYAGLIRKGCAEAPPAGSSDASELGTGHAAMTFEPSDVAGALKAAFPKLSPGTAPLPTGPKGNANLAFVEGYAMNAQTKQRAGAWKLISFLTGRAAMKSTDLEAGYLPARTGLRPARSLGAFARGATYATPWAWPAGLVVNAFPPIGGDIAKAAAGQQSYKASVADMAVWLRRYL